jgi:predicted RNA-binding Zn-ribbon protein involved in translation (DUF1610 family)
MARRRAERRSDYFVCPHCGAEVRAGARACPECGSDEQTGWAEDADKWSAGIPTGYAGEDEFDYKEFVRREFGGRGSQSTTWVRWFLVALLVTALALLVLL